uniref:Uncharacterized protein n=1 Tax=Glossina austeni TaxID=7395 RepID=A0A1A9VDK0_GLOAU
MQAKRNILTFERPTHEANEYILPARRYTSFPQKSVALDINNLFTMESQREVTLLEQSREELNAVDRFQLSQHLEINDEPDDDNCPTIAFLLLYFIYAPSQDEAYQENVNPFLSKAFRRIRNSKSLLQHPKHTKINAGYAGK